MIIGLTGLHGSGKSSLAEFLSIKFDWRWVVKRDLLKEWSGLGADEEAWTAWYRDLYQKAGSYEIMQHLIKMMRYGSSSEEVILLDAVHTPDEWEAVLEVSPGSILASVVAPKRVRLERNSAADTTLDIKRERFWHDQAGSRCLLSSVEWSFSGIADPDLRILEAKALVTYLGMEGESSKVPRL